MFEKIKIKKRIIRQQSSLLKLERALSRANCHIFKKNNKIRLLFSKKLKIRLFSKIKFSKMPNSIPRAYEP